MGNKGEIIIDNDLIKPNKIENGELQNYRFSSRIFFFWENFYLLVLKRSEYFSFFLRIFAKKKLYQFWVSI